MSDKQKDDTKISNFSEGYAQYNQTAINGSLDKYLKIFVTEHANLISTANKSIKKRMRELGLIDEHDNVIKDQKAQAEEARKTKQQTDKKAGHDTEVKLTEKLPENHHVKDDFKLDAKTFEEFAKARKTKTNKTGLSVVKQIPTDLLVAVRYTLGPDYARLTNQETVILALLVFVNDWHAINSDVQKLIQDSDPDLWEAARLLRQKRKQGETHEVRRVKHNVEEVYHLNKQLLLMLAYYISLSRWGFDNDNVNSVQDIDKLQFDTNSVRELLNATKDTSDKMIREERNRKGSNMA